MMAVLPDGFYHDERRIFGNVAEYFHAALLAIDKAVLLLGIEGMAAPDFEARVPNSGHHCVLAFRLRRPALLVRGQPEVAIGYKDNGIGHSHILACGIV